MIGKLRGEGAEEEDVQKKSLTFSPINSFATASTSAVTIAELPHFQNFNTGKILYSTVFGKK